MKEEKEKNEIEEVEKKKEEDNPRILLLIIFILCVCGELYLLHNSKGSCFMGLFGNCLSVAYETKALVSVIPCAASLGSLCANVKMIDKVTFIFYFIYNLVLTIKSSSHVREVSLMCVGFSILILIMLFVTDSPKEDDGKNEKKG